MNLITLLSYRATGTLEDLKNILDDAAIFAPNVDVTVTSDGDLSFNFNNSGHSVRVSEMNDGGFEEVTYDIEGCGEEPDIDDMVNLAYELRAIITTQPEDNWTVSINLVGEE